jgi:hypothetical protein
MIMLKGLSLIVVASFAAAQTPLLLDEWAIPDRIYSCLEKGGTLSTGPLLPFGALNPYYLRGDFDGDGLADLAVAVVEDSGHPPHSVTEALASLSQGRKGGIAICAGSGKVTVLGDVSKIRSFEVNNGALFTPGWRVESRSDLLKRLTSEKAAPASALIPLRRGKGEVIWLVGEDGSSVIYYESGKFRLLSITNGQ